MPIIRVSQPMLKAVNELAAIHTQARGRNVTAAEIVEILIANYRRTVEMESEDDGSYPG